MYTPMGRKRTEGGVVAEVGVAELRRDLKRWLERARRGEDVVITDRGRPIAKLSGVAAASRIEQLIAEGRISSPRGPKPRAADIRRVEARGSVSELVTQERDRKR